MRNRFVLGLLFSFLLMIAVTSAPSGGDAADRGAAHVRWNIINVNFVPPSTVTLTPGGQASAFAEDQSKITLTGSGTFVAPAGDNGTSSAATGGGTWQTFNPGSLAPSASGTYAVTGLVRWEPAPGFINPGIVDDVGNAADFSAGLAVLRIAYSDGSAGILILSCTFNSPPPVFEGITASKGFVDYWNRQAENFTLFTFE